MLVKMLASALVVVLATTVAERVGAFWGALITSLPISAGPIYVLLAFEHDASFLSESAIGSLTATTATSVYLLALTWLCPRLHIAAAIPLSVFCWLLVAAALRPIALTVISAGALTVGVLLACMAATTAERRWLAAKATRSSRYDIPLRALLVAILVALVTSSSRAIGPQMTGLFAVFPIGITSIALIIYLRQGPRAVATIMASSFLPMVGFAVALAALHVVAPRAGSVIGLLAGLTASIGWSVLLIVWRFWRRKKGVSPAKLAAGDGLRRRPD